MILFNPELECTELLYANLTAICPLKLIELQSNPAILDTVSVMKRNNFELFLVFFVQTKSINLLVYFYTNNYA